MRFLVAGLCLLLIAPVGRRNEGLPHEDQLVEKVKAVFPAARTVEYRTIGVSAADKESLHTRFGLSWQSDSVGMFVAAGPDSLLGFAVVDNVKGKDQLITYLVLVSPDLQIRGLEILAYRESFGGEVRNGLWRNQFKGKSPRDPLQPGRDISTITGATISARAVTLGVRKILAVLDVLRPKLPRRTGPGQ